MSEKDQKKNAMGSDVDHRDHGSQAELHSALCRVGISPEIARALAHSNRGAMDRIAANALGLALDGVGLIVGGLRYLDGAGEFDEPVERARVVDRLWLTDAAKRGERAELLRNLAALLDRSSAPTREDIDAAIPERIAGTLLLASLENQLRQLTGPRAPVPKSPEEASTRRAIARFLIQLQEILRAGKPETGTP